MQSVAIALTNYSFIFFNSHFDPTLVAEKNVIFQILTAHSPIYIEELEKMLHDLKETIKKPHIRKKKPPHHTHQTTTFCQPQMTPISE